LFATPALSLELPDREFVIIDGQIEARLRRRNRTMHARPEIRERLLAKKMQRWALIGSYPSAYPNCSASRARRNYARLLAKYPDLGRKLNLGIVSAYPPL
jgi:hypothetical protein